MANGDRVWQDLRFGFEHASTKHGLVTEADLANIIHQILVAVEYLHQVPPPPPPAHAHAPPPLTPPCRTRSRTAT
jgi:hypothetical protein